VQGLPARPRAPSRRACACERGRAGVAGLTAAELLQRVERHASRAKLSAAGLERWLIESGFAVNGSPDGGLRPTTLGREVGAALSRFQF